MAEKIIMPKAGMSMEFGTIIKWLKEIGDKVSYGEPLLEIETDKTSMQVEAMNDGYLLSKLYDSGDEVPVVTTIGYIGEKGEKAPEGGGPAAPAKKEAEAKAEARPAAAKQEIKRASGSGKVPATPLAKRLAAERGIDIASLKPASGFALKAADIPAGGGAQAAGVKASPLAARVAEQNGVQLSGIQGSGFGGKIMKDDVLAAKGRGSAMALAPALEDKLVRLNGMRKTIARRMLESHTEVPPVTLNTEADVTMLSQLRKQANDMFGGSVKISFNDLVVRACALALREFPDINASYTPEGIQYKKDINIGIAVALDDGLIVPVLKNADGLALADMSADIKDMAKRAREGALLPDEYTGGTFSVSNLGMFGIQSFTPIINQPEACILGVCAITDRLVMEDSGQVAKHGFMGLSLTFDHRCVDGAGGARFLQRVVQLLENPIALFM